MKTVIKSILILAVMFGTFTSYANNVMEVPPTFNFVKKGNQISVTDATGEVIYSGEINYNGNLTTLFDFSQLKNGQYTVEITKGFEIEINTIEVKEHIVSYIHANKKTIYKPVVRNVNGKILISKLAINTNEMDVELYFEGDIIHTEKVTEKERNTLNRIYKLDQSRRGNYTTIIKSDDRVFVTSFRI
ncbi:hypothetical protein [Winogradskyella bathintestinalis]|uniref:Uncharacterized protein n=1 Tax=Winogradskyella bathintestinalis TaxID=3035208 RepID=A0ABT7ZRP2_9FLAO|nr:hypothetical protein [Winogradskyella bathintestinalis]MDN3491680.1 hypothetical protein [Winogradskyella bathintestinalis]